MNNDLIPVQQFCVLSKTIFYIKKKLLNAISKDKDFISGVPNKPQNFKLENLSTLHYKALVHFEQKPKVGSLLIKNYLQIHI